jgi:hypothetical protein
MDIYTPSLVPGYARCPNCWTQSQIDVPLEEKEEYCTVKQVGLGVYTVVSHTPRLQATKELTAFWNAVESWGSTWMWDNLIIMGDISWIAESITDNSLLTITNGLYMKELYPSPDSAAFMFKCTKKWGQLMVSFVEHTRDACSYCGELLGLMTINILLLAVNKCNPDSPSSIQIFSDCLGALNKIENLPPYCIPTKCSHSDI